MAMLSAIAEGGPRRMTDALRPISDRLWLGTLCIVTLGALFGFRPRRSRTTGRNRKPHRQLPRRLHPRRPYLQRLQVGRNRSWRALHAFSAIRQRRAACKV
jgi:hypothetical protein